MQVFNAIEQTASQFTTPDTLLGYGISDFCAASVLLTSVNENSVINDELIVYPNPSNGKFQVSSFKFQVERMEVYNVLGEKVYSSPINHEQSRVLGINLSSQPSGVYVLNVKNENRSFSVKLVKY